MALLACAALTGGLVQAAPAGAVPKPSPSARPSTKPAGPAGVTDPGRKLGKGWRAGNDRAVTAAADSDGLRVLVADSAKAYAWRTAAVLSEPGMPADSWIGNQCVIDHDHAAVVYAPRSFTNKPDLMQGGAFAAVVDLTTGRVTKLPFTASLAYFDPSCNPHTHTAAFTAFRDMNDPADTRTRVLTVNTAGKTLSSAAAKGEITSAVPVRNGAVAALGRHLVRLDHTGVKNLLTAGGLPYDIHPAEDGKIAFVERDGSRKARARLWNGHGTPVTLATGDLGAFDLKRGGAAQVFLTGRVSGTPHTRGTGVTRVNAPVAADISSQGRLAVDPVLTSGVRAGIDRIKDAGKGFTTTGPGTRNGSAADGAVRVTSTATATGARLSQTVAAGSAGRQSLSPALTSGGSPDHGSGRRTQASGHAVKANVSHDPTDPDRWCSVSRNDVKAQALQPTPNQVEWAVDMAVRGELHAGNIRQGGYRNQTGMGTIDPQGLFPPPTLTGGGRIPVNVMLGIMAQESNLWQAESGSIPGQMGNPLAAVDGYYGHKADPGNPAAYWNINWDKSDCGYGVGQVTDGMRMAGHEKTGERSLSPALQKAVAVDYATNVAASLKILADKWNEVHTAGQKITVNNDDPSRVENWFTAVWNYNLGFNPPSQASQHDGHWGLGWYNNPANPIYKKSWGHPFMDTTVDGTDANHDAAHPQDWPYEEKVMGWAAWSIDTGYSYGTDGRQDWKGESGFSSAGFRPAWWTSDGQRSQVSPPLSTFCNSDNNCDPSTPPNCGTETCYAKFWYNKSSATWKTNCANDCGHELIKYQTLIPEPGRGHRLKNGEPVCSGAPTGAHVVASVPNTTETWSDCGQATSSGSFQFTFYPSTLGTHYEAKADLHQIGGGYGGHFWYTKTRDEDHLGGPDGLLDIDGTWTLGESMDLAQVWVHVPDTGAQTKDAHYVIHGALGGPYDRYVDQNANNGKWVSLGAYKFTSTPSVSLTNYAPDGTADADIAFGAIAFQPVDGTYVSDTIEADAFFDEDQNIDVRPESQMFNTPLKSRQDLHDWAISKSQKIIDMTTCIDVGSPSCVKPETKAAMARWNAEVKKSGTSTTDHPDGHSIPVWMHYSNPYTKRPSSDSRPSWFGTDDAAYKMNNKATVSYVKTSGGKIINGSESVTYDDRTADTHLPDFVREFFAALKQDYGTQPPDLDYIAKDLNVHNGRSTTTSTNSDGVLPGRAYKSIGVKPVITDDNDNVVTGANGTCVAVMHTAGGSIGYRTALADQHLTDSVADWVTRVSNDTGSSGNPVALMAQEIRNMFFKPGLTGSIFGSAPPIWQELDFKSCADGTIKKVSGAPVLRSSFMPNQYLYRNGKAIGLDGTYTGSGAPVTTGDFYHFSGPDIEGPADPDQSKHPYASCDISSGHGGNPWNIAALDSAGTDPSSAHFCNAPGKAPDPNYSR